MHRLGTRTREAAFVAGLLVLAAPGALAQMLGVPVLQNAFANPGITVAGNFGTQDGARGYGAAAAWAPGSGRFQLSVGGGVLDAEAAGGSVIPGGSTSDDRTRTFTWGARASFSFLERASGSIGVGAFAGAGGLSRDRVTQLRVPLGASLGWRRAIGETRAISVYVAPFYLLSETRLDLGGIDCDVVACPDETDRAGSFRVSGGVDFALARAIGITVGYEDGQRADDAEPGPSSGVFGVALSYAFGRR